MINAVWVASFAMLVRCGSFTAAAIELGITQAAISQHIARLEARFGPLVIRRPRKLDLTPAGEALLEYGRSLDRAESRLINRLRDTDAATGEISLITPGSVGLMLYPLLLDIQGENRGLTIRHRFAPTAEVIEAVLDTQYELGVVATKPDDPRLAVSAFAREELELVIPAVETVRDWDDLRRIGFIDHPDGQAMAARLLGQRFPRASGLRGVPVRGFSNQIGLILEPVARGFGFTVLPHYARRAFPRPEAIAVVPGQALVVDTLWLIHRAEWPLSRRCERAVAELQRRMAAMAEGGTPSRRQGGDHPTSIVIPS